MGYIEGDSGLLTKQSDLSNGGGGNRINPLSDGDEVQCIHSLTITTQEMHYKWKPLNPSAIPAMPQL